MPRVRAGNFHLASHIVGKIKKLAKLSQKITSVNNHMGLITTIS
ncbi:hypothetical protein ALT785_550015 [Alteromonas infernus]